MLRICKVRNALYARKSSHIVAPATSMFQTLRRFSQGSDMETTTIGDVDITRTRGGAGSDPFKIPIATFDHYPSEIIGHFRWMAQKYNMEQDMFICGHPGPLRRNMVLNFAAVAGLEVEYIALSRDTTENDLKQRREIRGNSVVFHDQAPVRAAINGRVLVLDGIEYAERNVLPTLNNLLENREMALEDGRFLTPNSAAAAAANTSPLEGKSSNKNSNLLQQVHPDFRVIALGLCVPPYSGRTIDPPLRSRFQSHFVDELSAEAMLELHADLAAGVNTNSLGQLVNFYESLRVIRTSLVNDGGTGFMSGLPVFSTDAFAHCLRLLRAYPEMDVASCLQRVVPVGSWLGLALPSRLRAGVTSAFETVGQFPSSPGGGEVKERASNYTIKSISTAATTTSTGTGTVIAEHAKGTARVEYVTTSGSKVAIASSVPSGSKPVGSADAARIISTLLPSQQEALANMLLDHSCGKHLCLLGPKGSGKSYLARSFGEMLGYGLRIFPLYQELTARDILQRRVAATSINGDEPAAAAGAAADTTTSSSNNSSASSARTAASSSSGWVDSPLIAAARAGDVCVLDGADRVDPQVLYTLRSLLQDGVIDLPNGERLVAADHPQAAEAAEVAAAAALSGRSSSSSSSSSSKIHPNFRVIALGLPPSSKKPEDARERWVSSDLGFAYHYLSAADQQSVVRLLASSAMSSIISSNSNNSTGGGMGGSNNHRAPSKQESGGNDISSARTSFFKSAMNSLLSSVGEATSPGGQYTEQQKIENTIQAVNNLASEYPELALSLRHILRLRRLLGDSGIEHSTGTGKGISGASAAALVPLLEQMLMIQFMPSVMKNAFYKATNTALGISTGHSSNNNNNNNTNSNNGSGTYSNMRIDLNEKLNTVSIGTDVSLPRRPVGQQPEKVPHPLFHSNPAHTAVLHGLMRALKLGEQSLLLIGNQGVGKNKLTDRLLELLNIEREYVQLHRDTTIQSLTMLPSLELGKITYEDSPMVRAARSGRALVVDEADKAPLEVVCLLKALAEDGEVMLHDGRRLLSHQRLIAEGGNPSLPPADVVPIHPDFLLIVLANRPGFPFLGNNFFRECGDVFSVHVINNLDMLSEVELLSAYGPAVNKSVINRIASAFSGLRSAHEEGDLSYPFSAREAVSVVKHLQAYPQDGVVAAVEGILGFDSLTPMLRRQIAGVFQSSGLPVPVVASASMIPRPPVRLAPAYPLPAAVDVDIDIAAITPTSSSRSKVIAPTNSSSLRDGDWYPFQTGSSVYSIQSNRLLSFTEEIGRLSVGPSAAATAEELAAAAVSTNPNNSTALGKAVSMVQDRSGSTAMAGKNALHVLTTGPLVLHSFGNVNDAIDTFRGKVADPSLLRPFPVSGQSPSKAASTTTAGGSYVRRELVNEEMSWRLGYVTPLLVPLGADEGGCAVIIPEISIALLIDGADPGAGIRVKHLGLKKPKTSSSSSSNDVFKMNMYFGAGNRSSSSGGSKGGSSSSSGNNKREPGKHVCVGSSRLSSSVCLMFQDAGTELSLMDLSSSGNCSESFDLSNEFPDGIASIAALPAPAKQTLGAAPDSSLIKDEWFITGYGPQIEGDQSAGRKVAVLSYESSSSSRGRKMVLREISLLAADTSSSSSLHEADIFGSDALYSSSSSSSSSASSISSSVLLLAGNRNILGATLTGGSFSSEKGALSSSSSSPPSPPPPSPSVSATLTLLPRLNERERFVSLAAVGLSDDVVSSSLVVRDQEGELQHALEVVNVAEKTVSSLNLTPAHASKTVGAGTVGICVLKNDLDFSMLPPSSDSAAAKISSSTDSSASSSSWSSSSSVAYNDNVVAVCQSDGSIRLFEVEKRSLQSSQAVWQQLFSSDRDTASWKITKKGGNGVTSAGGGGADGTSKPKTGLNAPKHGKEDPKNEPHVGGNTWAGGTGGSDTAGLGGRGGPYRLDKGHKVHQVSDEMKAEVSKLGREKAAQIAKEALARRLDEISMGHNDYNVYMKYKKTVEMQISVLRGILDELSRRSRERVWLRHQSHGDLDDAKLVDGLTGDRLVFKRRGLPDNPNNAHQELNGDNSHKKLLQFVVDCSGSMYRFNGTDRRLERMLEAVLLILESMPSDATNSSPDGGGGGAGGVDYCITGHSGDSDNIQFVQFDSSKPANESERLAILESMAAHTQYTYSGDNTLQAMEKAVKHIVDVSEGSEHTDRYVFVISDANFDRYGIRPEYLNRLMSKDSRVQVHLILIASLAEEATEIVKALPSGRAHACFETTNMPSIFKSILTATGGALDV